jgi:hypothetical protein
MSEYYTGSGRIPPDLMGPTGACCRPRVSVLYILQSGEKSWGCAQSLDSVARGCSRSVGVARPMQRVAETAHASIVGEGQRGEERRERKPSPERCARDDGRDSRGGGGGREGYVSSSGRREDDRSREDHSRDDYSRQRCCFVGSNQHAEGYSGKVLSCV